MRYLREAYMIRKETVMKKTMVIGVILALLLTGCGFNAPENSDEDMKKQSRIEIYSAQEETLLKTVDDQDTVDLLSETYHWEETEAASDNLVPEYKLLVYQEETLRLGQDPTEKRGYELIETIITFQDSPYIREVISSEVIKGAVIPENVMTSYYIMPEDAVEELDKLLSD